MLKLNLKKVVLVEVVLLSGLTMACGKHLSGDRVNKGPAQTATPAAPAQTATPAAPAQTPAAPTQTPAAPTQTATPAVPAQIANPATPAVQTSSIVGTWSACLAGDKNTSSALTYVFGADGSMVFTSQAFKDSSCAISYTESDITLLQNQIIALYTRDITKSCG